MFRITFMKFPGRKPFSADGSGVSHITTRRNHRIGLPPAPDNPGLLRYRLGRSARVKSLFTCFMATL
jgi:hypothetical protein